jgi:hypothetical protein
MRMIKKFNNKKDITIGPETKEAINELEGVPI